MTFSAACPHVIFHDVLGEERVVELLAYVEARQADFRPSLVRNRQTGLSRAGGALRGSVSFNDLGPFKAPIDAFARGISTAALERFGLTEPAVEPRSFEMTSFGGGDSFGAHIDTDERADRVKVLSCVYYFSSRPRRFSGGELRLYSLPALSARGAPGFIDITPETDTMIVFPSWLRHEVLPVQVSSSAWISRRFTINCWLHRVSPVA